ncbi:ICA69 protein, partial [Polypterus senegalus]
MQYLELCDGKLYAEGDSNGTDCQPATYGYKTPSASGYSREYYDQYVQRQDTSVVNKFQQKYWKTKQALIKVTGKKEDEHVVASDADLDAKLEEVETFRYRAISDTWLTVNRMEQSRTEYRGALLWMKDISQELDPDTYKQMEKFRKVQAQVRLSKTNFDKLKNDVCQKVDLLGASRCNLLSHILTTYQTTLLHFWEKTSHTMAAIHESFKGYQPYEFTTLKVFKLSVFLSMSLQDPMDKLLDQGQKKKGKKKTVENEETKKTTDGPDQEEQLISLDEENHNEQLCSPGTQDLLTNTEDLDIADKDEMTLLNEILNASSVEEGDFSKEWKAAFGDDDLLDTATNPGAGDVLQEEESPSGFLPSQLLDQNMNNLDSSLANHPKPAKDLSAWFSLFADLDPLANPDAIGKTGKDHELLNA